MHRSFRFIDDFIKALYGIRLMENPMPDPFQDIAELSNAYNVMMNVVKERRKPITPEFVQHIYPLVILALQWDDLKKQGKLTAKFRRRCRQRVATSDNFYGTMFEIDMASRFLSSGWDVGFVEDYVQEGKRIDFLCSRGSELGKIVGVECFSKRYADRNTQGSVTIKRLNSNIRGKAKKFEERYTKKLGIPLNERVLYVDITTTDYSPPTVLGDLERGIEVSSGLDAVVFTWIEEQPPKRTAHIPRQLHEKYKVVGRIKKDNFPSSYVLAIVERPDALGYAMEAFYIRPHVYPEPKISVGQPESLEDYERKQT